MTTEKDGEGEIDGAGAKKTWLVEGEGFEEGEDGFGAAEGVALAEVDA
jgi:hypothetical protein